MKVVGLLSGGKDSCYNLVHCVQQGHQLVALATLAPPASKHELDSYMYQTVGHDAVHLVAQAMRLPLYRRVIKGTALNQRSQYGSRTPATSSTTIATPDNTLEDETEDLYHLLMDVKTHHPDIEAVSVGAILSNYQRVRVEHVALRPQLNLVPLAFLWQRSQPELYAEMLDAGLVSILIKVAGIGLDERDLGKTLRHMHAKLQRLSAMYGAHVCGEGGEYETLTIDSPLFEKSIEVGDVESVVHSHGGFASVSYLRLKNANLVEKHRGEHQTANAKTPPLLDVVGSKTLKAVQRGIHASKEALEHRLNRVQVSHHVDFPSASIRRQGRYVVLSNITGISPTSSQSVSTEDQVTNAFTAIQQLLASCSAGLGIEHIAHINLFLRSQTLFARINSIYRTLFGVSPPTRACVALPALPTNCDLMINAIAFDDPDCAFDRRALHVQARSFWAPANIGPYSQSVVQAEKIWIAGQIGLVPSDLSLPEGDGNVELQAALSIQHARRILKATLNDMGGRSVHKAWVEGGLCWVEQPSGRVEVARRAWLSQACAFDDADDDEQEEAARERGWLGQTHCIRERLPPMLIVTLPHGALPRSAAIEWQLTAHTGRIPPPLQLNSDQPSSSSSPSSSSKSADCDDDDDDDEENTPGSDATDVSITQTTAILTHNHLAFEIVHTTTRSSSAKTSFGILTLRHLPSPPPTHQPHPSSTLAASIHTLQDAAYAIQLLRPCSTPSHQTAGLTLLNHLLSANSAESTWPHQTQLVRCDAIHTFAQDSTAQAVDLALVWHGI